MRTRGDTSNEWREKEGESSQQPNKRRDRGRGRDGDRGQRRDRGRGGCGGGLHLRHDAARSQPRPDAPPR